MDTMKRFFWMSALVAMGSWGCSSSSQSTDGMGGAAGSSGSTGQLGGTAGAHAGAGTSGKATSGGGANSTGGTGSSTAGNSATAGGTGTNGGASTNGGGSATAGTAGTTSTSAAACDNGIDDDGDGLIDGFDPECTGPLDNDEGTYATGIPGDNRDPKWQDCFFDGNSGAGDDDCRYATGCLTGALPQTDPDCKLTDACVKFCAPLTQNGCDCFGCCTVQLSNGSTVDITENAACSLANVDDTTACPRCVKNTQCGNTCGECELCPGKTVEDLPASCTPQTGTGGSGNVAGNSGVGGNAPGSGGAPGAGGVSSAGGTSVGSGGTSVGGGASVGSGGTGGVTWNCDGAQTCGPNLPPCAGSGEYCSFGCCIPAVR